MNSPDDNKNLKSEDNEKTKLSAMTNALFIGFLIGIIIYSIANNALGLFTLIPLYMVYRLVSASKGTDK